MPWYCAHVGGGPVGQAYVRTFNLGADPSGYLRSVTPVYQGWVKATGREDCHRSWLLWLDLGQPVR